MGEKLHDAYLRLHRRLTVPCGRTVPVWLTVSVATSVPVGLTALVALAVLITGCASQGQSKADDAQLTQLDQWLPGRYDNRAQVADDRRAGRTPHPARSLAVYPVESLMIGHHVFYIEERAADDGRRILHQNIISFDIVANLIVETVWSLTDPPRWRDAESNPELFTGLQPPDIKQIRGCQLTWKKEPTHFVALNDRQRCRTTAPDGGTALLETRIELTGDTIALTEQLYAPDGKPLEAPLADPFIRFLRRSVN